MFCMSPPVSVVVLKYLSKFFIKLLIFLLLGAMGTMMEPCSCLSKYFICIFNFLLFVMGSISVAVGLWVQLDKQSFSKFLSMVDGTLRFPGLSGFTHPDALTDASILLIVAGGLICIVSFLGYCGACCNSSCMMTLYGCFILVFLVMQIAAGCLAFFYKQRVENEIRLYLKDSIRDYYYVTPVNQSNTATLMWNYLMAQGCFTTVNNWVMGHLELVYYVALGLGIFELILMLLAFCLSKSESKYDNSCC
ncbi:hypothetical protein WDU94_005156 [Cyamophila willieti]